MKTHRAKPEEPFAFLESPFTGGHPGQADRFEDPDKVRASAIAVPLEVSDRQHPGRNLPPAGLSGDHDFLAAFRGLPDSFQRSVLPHYASPGGRKLPILTLSKDRAMRLTVACPSQPMADRPWVIEPTLWSDLGSC